MSARLLSENDEEMVIEVRVRKSADFMECEELIQQAANAVGRVATGRCLEGFDADGSPVVVAGVRLTAKATKVEKCYYTPFGEVRVKRYAYQSSAGGAVDIPLERNARIIGACTPRYARIVSSRYAAGNAGEAAGALRESHGLEVSRCFVQDVSALVAAQVRAKGPAPAGAPAGEEPPAREVATVSVGIDGTCLLFCEEGYRQAMAGTLALYDAAGERLHTTYVAAAPEYGKGAFLARMDEQIARFKANYPGARWAGVTDGAADYLPWLKGHTTTQVLDFWHATEHLAKAAAAMHRGKAAREEWQEGACHRLKHGHGAAAALLGEMRAGLPSARGAARQALAAACTYFANNLGRMNYASYRKRHLPIGSGVTEAACKSLVKQRMCGSGMKWRSAGADDVLTLRAITRTHGAWQEFWGRVARQGLSGPRKPKSKTAGAEN